MAAVYFAAVIRIVVRPISGCHSLRIGRIQRGLSRFDSVVTELMESIVVDTQMVGHFVEHCAGDLISELSTA